jgi:hypothetical protein
MPSPRSAGATGLRGAIAVITPRIREVAARAKAEPNPGGAIAVITPDVDSAGGNGVDGRSTCADNS